MSEPRRLTLRSCAVRGPKGERGTPGSEIIRVSVTNLIKDELGNITGATMSKTYAEIRSIVDSHRPIELIFNGYVLRLVHISSDSLSFDVTTIANPEDVSDGYAAIWLRLYSDETVNGVYHES